MNELPPQNLREKVLSRITTENVCPRGRFLFICYDSLVWLFWGLSVIIGAFAVAVTIFVITHSQQTLFTVTHDSFWIYFLEVAPYLWLVVFAFMLVFAVLNLRYSRRGYRFTVVQVMASSVVLSLAGGALLQLVGFGSTLDTTLGQRMAMYLSQEKMERKLWLMPEEGRLHGRQVLGTLAPTSTVIFEDASGVRWTIDVSELSPVDISLLASEVMVRVVGTTSSPNERRFHACGTFPWRLENISGALSREHHAFLERMYAHTERVNERMKLIEAATFAPKLFDPVDMNTCANLAMNRRIEKHLQD